MAELADAQASGACGSNIVWVQVPSPAFMRKCRNWQTSKTKDLVLIASVWVQVPSSALDLVGISTYKVFCFYKVKYLIQNSNNSLDSSTKEKMTGTDLEQ